MLPDFILQLCKPSSRIKAYKGIREKELERCGLGTGTCGEGTGDRGLGTGTVAGNWGQQTGDRAGKWGHQTGDRTWGRELGTRTWGEGNWGRESCRTFQTTVVFGLFEISKNRKNNFMAVPSCVSKKPQALLFVVESVFCWRRWNHGPEVAEC